MSSKFIKIITADNRFAFVFIMTFIIVVFKSFYTHTPVWVNSAWAMLSVLGVIVTVTAFVSLRDALESKNWPLYDATLLEAKVISSLNPDDTTYSPSVKYQFTFNNVIYQGNQIDFSALSASQAWAENVIEQLTKNGNLIKVHVNPADPDISVINPGIRAVHFLRFIVGPAMLIAGILFGFKIIVLP